MEHTLGIRIFYVFYSIRVKTRFQPGRGENNKVYINRPIVLEDGGDEYNTAAKDALERF